MDTSQNWVGESLHFVHFWASFSCDRLIGAYLVADFQSRHAKSFLKIAGLTRDLPPQQSPSSAAPPAPPPMSPPPPPPQHLPPPVKSGATAANSKGAQHARQPTPSLLTSARPLSFVGSAESRRCRRCRHHLSARARWLHHWRSRRC